MSYIVFHTDITSSGDEVKSGASSPVSAGQTPSPTPTEVHHALKSGKHRGVGRPPGVGQPQTTCAYAIS